mgnify:CR=1 FL=1
MLLDIQLDARPDAAATRAAELAKTGVEGLFTFEGPHDVFFPLVATATAGVDVDLMTNVAIATPRSAMHLANAAYDLQLMSGGRVVRTRLLRSLQVKGATVFGDVLYPICRESSKY